MNRVILSVVAALAALFLASCAGKPKPYDDNVSNLPQNSPQGWEGSAAFGSFFPQSQ